MLYCLQVTAKPIAKRPANPIKRVPGVSLGRDANSVQASAPSTAKNNEGPSVSIVAPASTVCGNTSTTSNAANQISGKLLYRARKKTPAVSSTQLSSAPIRASSSSPPFNMRTASAIQTKLTGPGGFVCANSVVLENPLVAYACTSVMLYGSS